MAFTDILGRELELGNRVVTRVIHSTSSSLSLFRIEKFTAKQIGLLPVPGQKTSRWERELTFRYSGDLVLVPDEYVLIWLLKTQGKA